FSVNGRHEVRQRPRYDREATTTEFEFLDDAPLQEAHRVARDRIAKAGVELLGDRGATDLRMSLEHKCREACARQIRRAHESVVPAADDGGVVSLLHRSIRLGRGHRVYMTPFARFAYGATAPANGVAPFSVDSRACAQS